MEKRGDTQDGRPYLRVSYKKLLPLLTHHDPSVRSGTVMTLGSLCCDVWYMGREVGGDLEPSEEMLSLIVPKFMSMIRHDESTSVCRDVLYSLYEMLQVIGQPVINHAADLINGDGVSESCPECDWASGSGPECEGANGSGPEDDGDSGNGPEGDGINGGGPDGDGTSGSGPEDDEASGNGPKDGGVSKSGPATVLAMLTEVMRYKTHSQHHGFPIGNCLLCSELEPLFPLIAAQIDRQLFLNFFKNYLIYQFSVFREGAKNWRDKDWRDKVHDSRLFSSVDLFAKVFMILGNDSVPFIDRLYDMFTEALDSEESKTRLEAEYALGAVYALGVLVSNSGEVAFSKYNDTLRIFKGILDNEKSDTDLRDTLCASICRMIISNHSAVPLADYIEHILDSIPHQSKYHDNKLPVFECLLHLYRSSSLSHGYLSTVIRMAGKLLGDSLITQATRAAVRDFLREINEKEREVITQVMNGLTGLDHIHGVDLPMRIRIRECLSDKA